MTARANQRYLDLYRKYETALRAAGKDYKTVEEEADAALGDRMRMCRQMRNYLTHSSDIGFLSVSDEQLSFVEGLIANAYADSDVLSNHLRRGSGVVCRRTDKVDDVAKRMARCHTCYLPLVERGDKPVAVSISDVMGLLAASTPARPKSLGDIRVCKNKIACFDMYTPMADVMKTSRPLVCGMTSDGKVAGYLFVSQPY